MWTEEDQDKALAWMEYQDSLCPGCKLPLAETTDRANEDGYDTEAVRCFSCLAQARAARGFSGEKSEQGGLLFRVWRAVRG